MTDILDAEILPDETEQTALVRVERRELATANPAAHVSLDLPGGKQVVPLTDSEFNELVTGQLYIGFYNLSGCLPDREEFRGIADLDRNELESMYGPDEAARILSRRKASRQRHMLTDGTPLHVNQRVALVPMHRDERRTRWGGEKRDDVLRCRYTFKETCWVTHFAIGSRTSGVLVGAQFNQPMPFLPGNGFKFGVSLTQVRQALEGQPVLPNPQKLLK